jgi:L-threonylcarbamoyladenylate synthase
VEIIKVKNKKTAIKKVLAVLKNGGLVIYPTETCYGVGGNVTNQAAVKKILEFKGQRGGKPISIAVAGKEMAKKYVEINDTADNLYQRFLPGPLTVVSKSMGKAVRALEAGQGTLGIRIPDYPSVLEIIRRFGRPITSTSANTSGKKTPYCLKDVLKYTSKKRLRLVNLFLDAGKLSYNPPSTVVDTTLNEPKVLRQGEIKIKATLKNTFISNSEEETKEIAKKIFEKHRNLLNKKAVIFVLQGELGSGKTQFAKGLASFLGIKENVVSPTFTIIREYPFDQNWRRPGLRRKGLRRKDRSEMFYHLDTWRLEKGEELLELGLEKMLKPGNIIAIEWLQKIKPILKKIERKKRIKLVLIDIKIISENTRKIIYNG